MPSIEPTGHYCRQCDTELWSESGFAPQGDSVRCPRCGSVANVRSDIRTPAKNVAIVRRRRSRRTRDIPIVLGASHTAAIENAPVARGAPLTQRILGTISIASGLALAFYAIRSTLHATENPSIPLASIVVRGIVTIATLVFAWKLVREGERRITADGERPQK